jgi:hypothetical protein
LLDLARAWQPVLHDLPELWFVQIFVLFCTDGGVCYDVAVRIYAGWCLSFTAMKFVYVHLTGALLVMQVLVQAV